MDSRWILYPPMSTLDNALQAEVQNAFLLQTRAPGTIFLPGAPPPVHCISELPHYNPCSCR